MHNGRPWLCSSVNATSCNHNQHSAVAPCQAVQSGRNILSDSLVDVFANKVVFRSLLVGLTSAEQLSVEWDTEEFRYIMGKYAECAHRAIQEMEQDSSAYQECRHPANMLLLLFLGYASILCNN